MEARFSLIAGFALAAALLATGAVLAVRAGALNSPAGYVATVQN